MWEMFMSSAQLFLKGKMFRDNAAVFKKSSIGVVVGLILLILLGIIFGRAYWWAAAAISGLVTGAIMPYLMKDLKYA